jgi:hypothetical protein
MRALSLLLGGIAAFLVSLPARALAPAATAYDIGAPSLTDVWVDPLHGNDASSGTTRSSALRTLSEAWNRIPEGRELSGGVRIQLMAGTYGRAELPNYMESRYGTAAAPIIIQAADGARSAHLTADLNVFDVRYLYVIGLDIAPVPAGDAFHCERCDHLLIRDSRLDGGNREAHDLLKVNQSQYVYIETSDIAGADDNSIDFVAVQYGHVLGNRVSNAQDWCMYAKGGSAYLTIDGNEFLNCGTGGFTAGQGTGFQFMTAPWIHYEAYDIKVVNNVIHDIEGAGLGVNGGYDILLAWNTLYRVGSRDHMLEVTYGNRSCDGMPGDEGRERCQQNIDAGGWGTTVVDDGSNYVRIPSRNVWIYNNVLYNPRGSGSAQVFSIADPWSDPATQNGSNAPVPATVDAGLTIRGNVIFDPAADLGLGGDSCSAADSGCNESVVRRDNIVDTLEPQFVSAATGDFHPAANSALISAATSSIPDFSWSDAPVRPAAPIGRLANNIALDRAQVTRGAHPPPGAYSTSAAAAPARHRATLH